MSEAQSPVESPADFGTDKAGVAARWIAELQLAHKETNTWETRVKGIEKRYRDDRNTIQDAMPRRSATYKFNVLWSNVQTLLPAIYARPPKPVVGRRFRDRDPVGRAASQIVERGLEYQIECGDLHETVKRAVEDYLLGGRGQVWLSYDPKYVKPDTEAGLDQDVDGPDAPAYEEVDCEYIFWSDFQTSPARTWREVRWVARRLYMTREQLRERFTNLKEEQIDRIPMDWKPEHLTDQDVSVQHQAFERAVVWEIWNKEDRRVYWICPGFGECPLDAMDDPLHLQGFFPCPRPLLATTTNGTLVPVPDYSEYQDQADQLDDLTGRIAMVTKAVKVAGLYPSDDRDIARLFTEGVENQLLPVTNWAAYMEKGGLEKSVTLMPVEKIAAVLRDLVEIRAVIKNDLYEITGIADIIRGSTKANETATAQQIKGRYATMRLSDKQQEVARFVRDILRMIAEIMCEHFSPETLMLMSDYEFSNDPGPDGAQKFMQAIQLLKDDHMRGFRIDIEDESTIAQDDQEEKSSRLEFLQAISAYLQQAVPAGQQVPEMAPLLGKMLLFGVRAFRAGRDLETSIEDALAQMEQSQKAAQGQPKPPGPDEIRAQAEMQKAQMQMQVEAEKAQAEGMRAQADMAIEQMKMEAAEQQAQRDHEFRMADLQVKLLTQRQSAERDAEKTGMERERMDRDAMTEEKQTSDMASRLDALEGGLMEVARGIAEGQKAIVEKIGSLGKAA